MNSIIDLYETLSPLITIWLSDLSSVDALGTDVKKKWSADVIGYTVIAMDFICRPAFQSHNNHWSFVLLFTLSPLFCNLPY